MSRAFNLNIRAEGQLVNGDAGPARLGFLVEDLVINDVDSSEVVNVRKEDIDLDNVVDAASGGI